MRSIFNDDWFGFKLFGNLFHRFPAFPKCKKCMKYISEIPTGNSALKDEVSTVVNDCD